MNFLAKMELFIFVAHQHHTFIIEENSSTLVLNTRQGESSSILEVTGRGKSHVVSVSENK